MYIFTLKKKKINDCDGQVSLNYQSSVATDEVVHGLFQAQLAHRWEYTKCITSQKDYILWMRANTRYLCIWDILYGICGTSVLCSSKIPVSMMIRFQIICEVQNLY